MASHEQHQAGASASNPRALELARRAMREACVEQGGTVPEGTSRSYFKGEQPHSDDRGSER